MLTAEQYQVERAICDKAQAFWKANATYSKGGWSSLSPELAAHSDYAACNNEMRGRVEQFEILRDMPEKFVAYVVKQDPATRNATTRDHAIAVWTGDILGSCYLGAGWRVDSYIGSRMYQATAWINGREYTGRTFGNGMCISLRETAASKRKRAMSC